MKRNVLVIAALLVGVYTAAWGESLQGEIVAADVQLYSEPTVIHLPCGIDLDTREPAVEVSPELMLSAPQSGTGSYLVQFDGPVYPHEREMLESSGAAIDGYVPNYTYIVRMDEVTRSRVEKLDGVRWVGDYHPGYKICKEIDLQANTPREFVVLLYPGEDPHQLLSEVEKTGGVALGWQASSAEIIAHVVVPPSEVRNLVTLPQVKWIEPYYPPYLYNGSAQWVLQTWKENNRKIWDKGLKGQGQIINLLDSGIRTTHNFFRDPALPLTAFGDYPTHRKIIGYKPTVLGGPTFGDDEVVGHGTHTSGTAAGNDRPVGGLNPNIGMAPEAKIYFSDGGSNSNPYGLITGFDLESVLNVPYTGNSAGGARISSHSWGNQTTREYNSSCVQMDRCMWNRPDYLVLTSAGNTDRGDYTGSPANAKNLVAVGGSKNGVLAALVGDFTVSGPSSDGRIRPDVVAPGELVSSSSKGDELEVYSLGTSMSCPAVAGVAALVRQYFTEGWYPSGEKNNSNKITPSAALLKAMLINSGETDYFNRPVPDVKIGWGRVNLDDVLYFNGEARTLRIVDEKGGLETGEKYETKIVVQNSEEPLKVTLVWTDYPGESYASPALVNDLNLEVVSPSSNVYKGNNFSNNISVTGGSFDVLNTVENVFPGAPETGEWKIKVYGNNIPVGPQPFALVVTYSGTLSVEETSEQAPIDNLAVTYGPYENSIISYSLAEACDVRLEAWDVSGRRVKSLYGGFAQAGPNTLSWETTDLAPGIYFVTLRGENVWETVRAVIVH